MNEQAYGVAAQRTWRERWRYRLLPSPPCPLPDAPLSWADCVVVTSVVSFDWLDRLRLLVTGTLKVQTRTVTEHVVGGAVTTSVAYPIRKPVIPPSAPPQEEKKR